MSVTPVESVTCLFEMMIKRPVVVLQHFIVKVETIECIFKNTVISIRGGGTGAGGKYSACMDDVSYREFGSCNK